MFDIAAAYACLAGPLQARAENALARFPPVGPKLDLLLGATASRRTLNDTNQAFVKHGWIRNTARCETGEAQHHRVWHSEAQGRASARCHARTMLFPEAYKKKSGRQGTYQCVKRVVAVHTAPQWHTHAAGRAHCTACTATSWLFFLCILHKPPLPLAPHTAAHQGLLKRHQPYNPLLCSSPQRLHQSQQTGRRSAVPEARARWLSTWLASSARKRTVLTAPSISRLGKWACTRRSRAAWAPCSRQIASDAVIAKAKLRRSGVPRLSNTGSLFLDLGCAGF